jgi:hypothetical protein
MPKARVIWLNSPVADPALHELDTDEHHLTIGRHGKFQPKTLCNRPINWAFCIDPEITSGGCDGGLPEFASGAVCGKCLAALAHVAETLINGEEAGDGTIAYEIETQWDAG